MAIKRVTSLVNFNWCFSRTATINIVVTFMLHAQLEFFYLIFFENGTTKPVQCLHVFSWWGSNKVLVLVARSIPLEPIFHFHVVQ